MRAFWLFAGEAFADAMRRRLVIMIALMTGFALLFLRSCTAAFTGTIDMNGQELPLDQLGPAVGIVLFAVFIRTAG